MRFVFLSSQDNYIDILFRQSSLNPNYAIGDEVELFALIELTPIYQIFDFQYYDIENH